MEARVVSDGDGCFANVLTPVGDGLATIYGDLEL
jgi:hypothetical protein